VDANKSLVQPDWDSHTLYTTRVVDANYYTTDAVKINFDTLLDWIYLKFVSDLRQVDGFFRVLRFPPMIKWNAMI
jgi:hypothetical protein